MCHSYLHTIVNAGYRVYKESFLCYNICFQNKYFKETYSGSHIELFGTSKKLFSCVLGEKIYRFYVCGIVFHISIFLFCSLLEHVWCKFRVNADEYRGHVISSIIINCVRTVSNVRTVSCAWNRICTSSHVLSHYSSCNDFFRTLHTVVDASVHDMAALFIVNNDVQPCVCILE